MPQNEDGTPHITYFDFLSQTSFVWDGESTQVEVCHGGYGEPVVDTIDVQQVYPSLFLDTDEGGKPKDWLQWFKVLCDWYLDRVYEVPSDG